MREARPEIIIREFDCKKFSKHIKSQQRSAKKDIRLFCINSAVALFNGVSLSGDDNSPVPLSKEDIECRLRVLEFLMGLYNLDDKE